MLQYIIKRILILIPTWIVLGIIIFLLINVIPGDPIAIMLGTESVENVELIRQRMGLDKSIWERLGLWVLGLVKGDLGESYFLGRSVGQAIIERIPVTISLAFLGMLFSVIIGVPLGIFASLKPNSLRDTSIMGFSLVGISIPEFFLGLILIYIFALGLNIFPTGGYVTLSRGILGWLGSLFLPALSIGIIWSAYIARLMRSSMLEVLNQEYIITARAKGQSEYNVVIKHALRNGILPIVTAIGMIFALLLSGAFITEYLFRLPGAGSLIISSIKKRDYPVVQGGLLFFASAILIVNLIVDILYAFIDPRIKYGKKV
ncbi:MAG: ABC transporter permease [Sphaerochaetaceae bacterium]|nr:ABC transporter permease [Sphaerochaetaceae bacterium]